MGNSSSAGWLLFAPHHARELGARVAAALHRPLAPSEEREFDYGEHKMRPLDDVRGRDCYVLQALAGDDQASVNDRLCRALFFIGALKDAGALRVTALLPYLAYARKDRRTKPHDPITMRYVAALLEAVGTDRVVVLEVHNEAAFDNAFRCETVRLEAAQLFAETIAARTDARHLVVVSPDVGGIKRVQQLRTMLAAKLGSPIGVAFMEKTRSEGVVSGEMLVGDVAGRDVLIYDDLVSSGTTLLRATRACRQAGARRVVAAATHPVFTSQARQLFEPGGPEYLLVSDSVPLRGEFATLGAHRLTVCSIVPLLAAVIERLQRCEPLQDLARGA